MRAVTFGVAALLCACQPQQPPTVTQAGAAPSTNEDDQRLSGFAVSDPVEPWWSDEAPAETAAIPADLHTNPSKLRGLSSPLLHAALGVPNFRRRDRNAEIWQYYGEGCVLDLFLYEEAGQNRVTHYIVRSRTPGEAVPTDCLSGIIANKPRQRGGDRGSR